MKRLRRLRLWNRKRLVAKFKEKNYEMLGMMSDENVELLLFGIDCKMKKECNHLYGPEIKLEFDGNIKPPHEPYKLVDTGRRVCNFCGKVYEEEKTD